MTSNSHTAARRCLEIALLSLFALMWPFGCAPAADSPSTTGDRTLELDLEELYTLGRAGGEGPDDWQQFENLREARFAPDGRLYLRDSNERVIAVDTAGNLRFHVGRRGEGPGEYNRAGGIVPLASGGVAVWDAGRRAFVVFDAAGKYVKQVRPSGDQGRPGPPFFQLPDGRVAMTPQRLVASTVGHAFLSDEGVKSSEDGLPLFAFALEDGAEPELITRIPMPVWPGTGRQPVRRAFEPDPSWGVLARGRFAIQHADTYRIDIVDPTGHTLRSVERPVEARPTSDADRTAYERQQAEDEEQGRAISMGPAGGTRSGALPEIETWFHPVVPPVLEIATDEEDHIWVQRRDPEDPLSPGPIDILTADGDYLGSISRPDLGLPAGFGPDGRVAFLTEGEYDVPLVRVFRLPDRLR